MRCVLAGMRALLRILLRQAGLQVVAVGPVDRLKFLRRQHLASFPVDHEHKAGASGMQEKLAVSSLPGHIDQNIFHDLVVVPGIVSNHLVRPFGLATLRIARPNRDRPFVVAGPHIRIPDARISRSVKDQIQFRIVGNPTPNRTAAHFPLAGIPRFEAQILTLILCVERFEIGTDESVRIGTAVPRASTRFCRTLHPSRSDGRERPIRRR